MSNLQDSYAFWRDEENLKKLRELHAQGLSNGQIAKAFGGVVSRNAIIGKVARLGLKRGAVATSETQRQGSKQKAAIAREEKRRVAAKLKPSSTAPSLPVPPSPPKEPPAPPKARMLTLVELNGRQCKWPIGDDRPQRFCAMTADEGAPYCAYHRREALPKERRDAPPRKAGELTRQLRRFI